MIFISSRQALTNEEQIGPVDTFWDVTIRNGMRVDQAALTKSDLQSRVSGKRILVLVHGYNNELEDVVRAYDMIEDRVKRFMKNKYDFVIGYVWPGGDDRLDYFAAKTRSGALAPRFRKNLKELHGSPSNRPKSLDIMTHSMGSRLALGALNDLPNKNVVRNLFLTGSAIDNESLEKGEAYFAGNSRPRNSYVFHSKHDQVLGLAYRLAEWDRALGQNGPENPADLIANSRHTFVINAKNKIKGHGGYKSSDDMFKFLNKNVDTPQATQFSTL